jgi:hypothetical protein
MKLKPVVVKPETLSNYAFVNLSKGFELWKGSL